MFRHEHPSANRRRNVNVSDVGKGRVVFRFSGDDIPVFLLTVFAKNEKADVNPREPAALTAAAKQMVEKYRRRR